MRRRLQLERLEQRIVLDAGPTIGLAPEQAWGKYLGGIARDGAIDVMVDSVGDIVVAGYAFSFDLAGANNEHQGGGFDWDGWVTKLAPDGEVRWATYLGGIGDDRVSGIALDADGNIIVTGLTGSGNFSGAANQLGGLSDGFVAKLTGEGELVWATYLGGTDADSAYDVVVTSTGALLVVGATLSIDFPEATNEPLGGSYDGFIAQLTADGELQWSSYLGGNGELDLVTKIALDDADNIHVVGYTNSDDIVQATNSPPGGDADGFLMRLDPSGAIEWTTYIGGGAADWLLALAIDPSGGTHVAGFTQSDDMPEALNAVLGEGDGFVARVAQDGSIEWSTYVGGSAADGATGLVADSAGNLLVAGRTESDNVATADNLFSGQGDALVARVTAAGSVEWATYLGGGADEESSGVAIALDAGGAAVIAGTTQSHDVPALANEYLGGAADALLVKIAGAAAQAVQPGVVRGSVFLDRDADGELDLDEGNLAGWTVRLTGGPDPEQPIERQWTIEPDAGAGTCGVGGPLEFEFINLPLGAYQLELVPRVPAESSESDPWSSTTTEARFAEIQLTAGQPLARVDFGERFAGLNGDELVDAADIDVLRAAWRDATAPDWFDLDGDGQVTHDDAKWIVECEFGTSMSDSNLDRAVDTIDILNQFAFWTGALGAPQDGIGFAEGDADGDGDVDAVDQFELFANWTGAVQSGPPRAADAAFAMWASPDSSHKQKRSWTVFDDDGV